MPVSACPGLTKPCVLASHCKLVEDVDECDSLIMRLPFKYGLLRCLDDRSSPLEAVRDRIAQCSTPPQYLRPEGDTVCHETHVAGAPLPVRLSVEVFASHHVVWCRCSSWLECRDNRQ